MVTILLEQIIEILKGWLSSFTSWAEDTAEKLGLIEEATEYIDDIYDETTQIQANTSSIATSNTMIQGYSLNISNKTSNIDSNVNAIKNNVGSIATSAGTAAAFAEDIASNTLSTLDKITTIASDTTQMRANTNNIYSDVDEIKTLLRYFSSGLIMEEDSEGPIAICDTDLTDYLVSCKCGFSTTKVNNTLVGVDKVKVTRTGKNLLPSLSSAVTVNNIKFSPLSDGAIDIDGTASGNASIDVGRNEGCFLQAGTYYVNTTATPYTITVFGIVNGTVTTIKNGGGSFTLTNPTQIFVRVFIASGTTVNHLRLPLQLELGSTATTYEAPTVVTFLINLGGTYYGGELDALNGRLKITHGYIASYNGESINEPWISSLDDYVPNTSPTTGAEVVYPLISPYYVAVNNITIRTLKGINNVYNDCDNTFVTYKETVKHYFEKQEA